MIPKPDWLVNFTMEDFCCHCSRCQENPYKFHTKLETIRDLQELRTELQMPLTVSRGVSCLIHNREIGGAILSRHLPDYADGIDLVAPTPAIAYAIVAGVMKQHKFTCVRVYEKHVHIDQRPGPFMFLASPQC